MPALLRRPQSLAAAHFSHGATPMELRICVLAGDYVGPEVAALSGVQTLVEARPEEERIMETVNETPPIAAIIGKARRIVKPAKAGPKKRTIANPAAGY